MSKENRQSGFTALVVVVIVGAASLVMAYSAAFLGLGELELGYSSARGSIALSIADGCMEEVLRRIRLDATYGISAGTINLTVPNGSCDIDVADLGAGRRRITVHGIDGEYSKKIQAEIALSGTAVTVESWQELSS